MDFIKYEFNLNHHQGVEVTLGSQANVKLMTLSDFGNYQRGLPHNCYGGVLKVSPYVIYPGVPGHYILTIDLGGYAGTINHSARVIERAATF